MKPRNRSEEPYAQDADPSAATDNDQMAEAHVLDAPPGLPEEHDPDVYQPKQDVTWHSLLEFCHTHIGCLDTDHRSWRLEYALEKGADGRPKRPDLPEAFAAFLDERARFGIHDGLTNIQALVDHLGLTQQVRRAPTILIGGTNGKGTVATALGEALSTVHYRPGVYTSPHVERFLERIQVSGGDPDLQHLAEACDAVRTAVEALDDEGIHCTYFETATALAFHIFAATKASPWILEVGLGGRLDATNVVSPLASAITNVGDDHADRLGATLGERVREKAGIMREGVTCFTTAEGEALTLLRQEALHLGARLVPVLPKQTHAGQTDRANVALVRAILGHAETRRRLRNLAYLDPVTVRLPALPARQERFMLREGRSVIVDVAHNTQALDRLAAAWPPTGRSFLLAGMLADKDPRMWEALPWRQIAGVTATTPRGARAMPAATLAEHLASQGHEPVDAVADPEEALYAALRALEPGDTLIVTGSFRLAEVARPILLGMRKHAGE